MNPIDVHPIPVNIQMPGNQTRQILHIHDVIQRGEFITHILNIKVSNQPQEGTHATQLSHAIKNGLWNVHITQNIEFPPRSGEFIPVTIRWIMPGAGTSCAYYYCVTQYNDFTVEEHVRLTISAICNRIRQDHREFGDEWGAAYLVTKPLDFHLRLEREQDVDEHA
jgi:hypothetical protein